MSKRTSSRPKLSPGTEAHKAARAERLAAEMRNNLMKRKRQQREMTAGSGSESRDDNLPDEQP